ncbi:unnamed protein product [Closterium sp. NIES-54]
MVTTTTPGDQRVSICTCTQTGHHLATFTRRPGSSLYTLTTEPPQVAASLPPLPPSPAPPCLSCVKGRQRAAPHSSFPPTIAPLLTLHMDVWGPARVSGQDRERYFLLVVEDYTRYTTVFPLRSKGQVVDVLIPWIRTVCLQLRERFRADLFDLRLHSDRGGEFSSDLLWDFCRGEGILQLFTLSGSPQQNGVAERRIGLVMEVACTSMIHATAPHFLWPFAVRYVAHQLNPWPCVSLPETSPTLRWTGKVGDALVFQVWGSRAFVRDTSADKLSSCAIPYVFLGFPPDALGWQLYHPTSCRVLPSQYVTFDESVPFYRLFPYRTTTLPPPPLFLAPVDLLPPQVPAPSGVSQVDPLPGTVPVKVAVDSGAARGAASGGVASGGAEPEDAEPGGAVSEGAESGGAELGGVEPGGTEPEGVEPGGTESEGAESGDPLSPQQLREWFAQCTRLGSGAAEAGGSAAGGTGAGGAGAVSLGGVGVTSGARSTRGSGAAGPGGARTRGTRAVGTGGVGGAGARDPRAGDPGAGGTGAGGAGAKGARAGDPGAGGAGAGGTDAGGAGAGGTGAGDSRAGGTDAGGAGAGGAGAGDPGARGTGAGGAGAGGVGAGGTGAGDPGAGGAGAGGAGAGGTSAGCTVQRFPFFLPPRPSSLPPPDSVLRQPNSPVPAPSPYAEQTHSFTERRKPEFRPALPVRAVRTGRRVPCARPPPVLGAHVMALRPSFSDRARAASPTVSRLLATLVTNPSFESTIASALIAELVHFAATCRLDYATALVAESESDCPPSVVGECALRTDVLEDRQEDFECLADAVPRLVAMLLAPEGDPDALDIPTPRSYAEAITGPYSSQWQTAMDAEMAS